jgi:hypothetical protein
MKIGPPTLNKIKIENYIGTWKHFWCSWKAFGESNLIKHYFTNFRTKVWKIFIFEWILLLKIQKNCQKLNLEVGKII